jgi:hypothetical protein
VRVTDVHEDDLHDHLSSWVGPSLYDGDLVRAVGDGHESLYAWSDSKLCEVRDERGPLTASQWEGEDADAVEMLRRCAMVDRRHRSRAVVGSRSRPHPRRLRA